MNITKPALILNKEQVISNITKMVDIAEKHSLFFRPHFKTHQSRVVGEWFRSKGITGITVSSVEMAEYFQQSGWKDITIAFPYNFLEAEKIDQLAGKCCLNILIVNVETILSLRKNLTNELSFFIEIDNGYHRTGIDPENFQHIDEILTLSDENELLNFKGFLTHAGNSYNIDNISELETIHAQTADKMNLLKQKYARRYKDLIISTGDTPGCSLMNDFNGIDEIRPGNFVFYDLMQEKLGSCSANEIAVVLACPVVAKNQDRLEIAIYGGAIHISKEYVLDSRGNKLFGKVVFFNDNGWCEPVPETTLFSLSQEHGIIRTSRDIFQKINLGDVIGILPVHSCLTADAMGEYLSLQDEIIDHM